MNLFDGIWNQSGISSIFLLLNVVLGFLGMAHANKGEYNNYLFLLCLLLFLLLKLNSVGMQVGQLYSNLISILSFPCVLFAIPLYRKLLSNRRYMTVYIYSLIIFFILDFPFLRLFSNVYIPNYSTQIIYVGGITNILSLSLIRFPDSKHRRLGKLLFFITYVPTLLSLSKWMLPIIFISPMIFLLINSKRKASRFRVLLFLTYFTILVGVFNVVGDDLAKNIGYDTMEDYLNVRVYKTDVSQSGSIEQDYLLGIGDGNRFNIYSKIVGDYLDSSLFFGLNMNYINVYNVPAHNLIVFYISMLGFFGVFYIYMYLKALFENVSFIEDKGLRYIIIFFIVVVLFNFMVGESYGSVILLTFIFINLNLLKINVLRSDHN